MVKVEIREKTSFYAEVFLNDYHICFIICGCVTFRNQININLDYYTKADWQQLFKEMASVSLKQLISNHF